MSKNTLKSLTFKKFKTLYPKAANFRNRIVPVDWKGFFNSPLSFGIVFLSIVFANLLCFVDLKIPSIFYFEKGEIFSYVKDWLTWMVSLFGVLIVVTIFIIQSLQAKNPEEDLFQIIFKETYFYPALYSILASISIMLFISFRPIFINEAVIIRITVLNLYIFILFIFYIAYLFRKIFLLLKSQSVFSIYINQINAMLEKNILLELETILSEKIYREKMIQLGFEHKYWFDLDGNSVLISIKNPDNKVLADVDFTYFQAHDPDGKIQFIDLAVNKFIPREFPFLNSLDTSIDKAKLVKALRLKSKPKLYDELELIKKNLKARLGRHIKRDQIDLLRLTVNIYIGYLENFIKLYDKYRLHEFNNADFLQAGLSNWKAIVGIEDHFQYAIDRAVQNKNDEAVRELMSGIDDILIASIFESNVYIISIFKFSFIRIYFILSNDKELLERHFSWLTLRLKEIVGYYLFPQINNTIDDLKKENLKRIRYEFFDLFNSLMKYSIREKDANSFKLLMKNFSDLPGVKYDTESLDKETNLLVESTFFGQFAWLTNLYRFKKIDDIYFDLVKFIEIEKRNLSIIIEGLFTNQVKYPYDWHMWEIDENGDSRYSWIPVRSSARLIYALALLFIRHSSLLSISQDTYNNLTDSFYVDLKDSFNDIKANIQRWVKYFDSDVRQDELLEKINILDSKLEGFQKSKLMAFDQRIIQSTISKKSVQFFKESNYSSWLKENPILRLFEAFDAVNYEQDFAGLNTMYGLKKTIFNGYKKRFLDDEFENLKVLSDFGRELGRAEKEFFISLLEKYLNKITINNKNLTPVDHSIASLYRQGYRPNVLIVGFDIMSELNKLEGSSYIKNTNTGIDNISSNFIGQYNGLKVYYLNRHIFRRRFIISEFKKCFKMKWAKKDGFFYELDIVVNNLSEERIKKILDNPKSPWRVKSSVELLPYKEAKKILLKSLELAVQSHFNIEILDENAFSYFEINYLN